MDQKTPSTTMLAIGIMILVASLFADSLGIGGNSDFGPIQSIGAGLGVALTGVGLFLKIQSK